MKVLREKIFKALRNPPIRKGFTVRELSEELHMPSPTARWHLELLEASGEIDSSYVGKSKLYKRVEKKE